MSPDVPSRSLHIAGTGTFAAEVIELAAAAGFAIAGLVEPLDPNRIGREAHGFTVQDPAAPPFQDAGVVVGIGRDRQRIGAALERAGWMPQAVIHPSAVVSPSAAIGAGVVVGPLVVIGAHARVDDHALLGRGVLLGHHSAIGAGATLNPGANVAGMVTLGAGVMVGMNAAVADHLTVGDASVIAAGAVVVRDVPARTRVQGVPARPFAAGAAT